MVPSVQRDVAPDYELRFRVEDTRRADTDEASEFDPDGRDDTYEVVGESFHLEQFELF